MDRDEELRLLRALRAGDERAFAPVYEAYSGRIFTFILRMVRRRAIADELAQDTWMRLAVRAVDLREDTRLEPWLFTVARNLCASYWRTRGIEGVFDTDDDTLERLRDARTAPDRTAEAHELRSRTEAALVRVPRMYREVLLLVGVEGMTPAEAAAVCGVSPEAMRKRLERARDMLAGEMRETQRPRDVRLEVSEPAIDGRRRVTRDKRRETSDEPGA